MAFHKGYGECCQGFGNIRFWECTTSQLSGVDSYDVRSE